MGLAANVNEIAPSPGFDTGSGLARRTAHGRDVSISHATFPHGYRSAPHAYEGEEISQLIEGELTVYLQGQKYELKAGDVIRIPRLAIHWKHNGGQTEAVMLELHNPPLGGNGSVSLLDTFERDDASYGAGSPVRFGRTYLASRHYADGSDDFAEAAKDDPLRLADGAAVWAGLPSYDLQRVHASAGKVRSLVLGGESLRLMLFERDGLKSVPHFHAAEQITYVVSGAIDTFLDDRVIRARAGDFVRVPGNVVHWAIVEPGQKSLNFEVHTPIEGNPLSSPGLGWLVPERELPGIKWIPGGFATDALEPVELEALEARLLDAENERLRVQTNAVKGLTPSGAQR